MNRHRKVRTLLVKGAESRLETGLDCRSNFSKGFSSLRLEGRHEHVRLAHHATYVYNIVHNNGAGTIHLDIDAKSIKLLRRAKKQIYIGNPSYHLNWEDKILSQKLSHYDYIERKAIRKVKKICDKAQDNIRRRDDRLFGILYDETDLPDQLIHLIFRYLMFPERANNLKLRMEDLTY